MPGAAARCSTPASVGLATAEGTGVAVEAIVCAGLGVALGTSNRPRRCDGVGKADADDVGVEVAADVGDCSDGANLRDVTVGSGVDVAATEGACVADIVADGATAADVDVGELASVVELDALIAFTNFFDGAFEGGVASDFILSRVFLAAS